MKRAEEIKLNENSKLLKKSSPPPAHGKSPVAPANKAPDNDNEFNFEFADKSNENVPSLSQLKLTDNGASFTKDEINVLRRGSCINGRDYVPFFPEIDAKDRFSFPIPFTYMKEPTILNNL